MKIAIKILFLALPFFIFSCSSAEKKKEKAEEEGGLLVSLKAKLLKGAGDALKTDGKEAAESASEGIGEVIKGVSYGFDKSLNQANVLPDSIFCATFDIGRTEKMYADTSQVKKVTVYLVAKANFDGKVKVKAFDKDRKEIGRSLQHITMAEDEAKFFDFEFDHRTPLFNASYFIISK